jgi:SAM-dependent methyltransferase
MVQPVDAWQSGRSYEQYMGRWSILIARQFLEWLPVAPNKAWLEVGCGTGAISGLIRQSKQPGAVLAIDSSPDFISFARENHQGGPIHFGIGLAQSLPTVTGYFDAVVSGLVLNFIPEPLRALEEMRRATKPGGVVAAYVWDYAEGMQMLRFFWDAAVVLEPPAAALDEGIRFPLCRQGSLHKLFTDSGFRDIQSRPVEARAIFSSFEDYWQPFQSGVGPAPGYVASLDAAQKRALEQLLKQSLPKTNDGAITFSNRAWAVQGRV